MRLIDKLIPPPQDKYILLPTLDINFNLPFLGKFKTNRTGRAISFAIEDSFIRILEKNTSSEKKFKFFEKLYTSHEPLEQKLRAIEDYIKERNLTEVKIGTYIPSRYGIVRLYSFPSNLKKSEILKALELYIQEEISEIFSDKEVVYAYTILHPKKDEPYKTIVSIVEASYINVLNNWASNANLNLKIISYEPICILNFGFLNRLPIPFTIIYTEYNKILIISYSKNRLSYEIFTYSFDIERISEDSLNMLIWDLRNYIVLNDLSNIFLSGIILEYTHLIEYFLERLPIFGLLTLDNIPERYSLLYTLAERLVHV